MMKNKALDDIKNFAVKRLTQEYGYCGLAEGDDMAMLNSDGRGEDIIIKIESKKDEGG